MTSIFLSYARGDDEPFVKRLEGDLTNAGFDVWFDRKDLRSRGLTFHQEIREAISKCDRLLLVVGPQAVTSEYVRQEWQFAWFDAEKIVTPILRLNGNTVLGQIIDGYAIIPDELKLLHCEDFRDDAQYPFHRQNLLNSLRTPAPPLGMLIGVPSLPSHYLTRTDRLLPLRDAVRSGLDSQAPLGGTVSHQMFHGIASASRHVGMHGMGGIGKSVLANLLAHDRLVRLAFPNGIVWVGLGSAPNLVELMNRVHKVLGGEGAFGDEHEGKAKLKELLHEKAVLLILDDVWRKVDADTFDVLGPRCRALITTRDSGLLKEVIGTPHLVELLTDEEAVQMLAVTSGKEIHELPVEAQTVLKECGRLPLAVSLAGGMVQAGMPWRDLLDALRCHELEFLADEHRPEQHQDLWKLIEVSVKALKESDQCRLVELAVFPEDVAVPDAAVATLWESAGGLSGRFTRKLLIELKQRSLVQITSSSTEQTSTIGNVSLHDLIHDYCIRRAELLFESVSSLHEILLTAYRAKCQDGWHSGPNDGYFFQHLRRHLIAADRTSEANALLINFDWLGVKTQANLASDLAVESQDAIEQLIGEMRQEFLPWYYFIRKNAPFLSRFPTYFFQQAYNEPRNSPVSCEAQLRWKTCKPRNPDDSTYNFMPPTWLEWTSRPTEWGPTNCLMTLLGHSHYVTAVAISDDESLIASGSRDNSIKLWDAVSGIQIHELLGHKNSVIGLVVNRGDSSVVSGSSDHTVKIWDLKSGECRITLEGHTDSIYGIAVSKDAKTVVSGSSDGTVRIWNATTGICLKTLPHDGAVRSVSLSNDNQMLLVHSDTVTVWDLHANHCKPLGDGLRDCFVAILSPNGKTAVTKSEDLIVVWDVATNRRLRSIEVKEQFPSGLAASTDLKIIVSSQSNGDLALWDGRNGDHISKLIGHSSPVFSVAISADGRSVVSGSQDKTVKVWQYSEAQVNTSRFGHDGRIRNVAISQDTTILVTVSDDLTAKLWDVSSQECKQTFIGHTQSVRCAVLSIDGTTVITGSDDLTIRVWDVATGQCRRVLSGHNGTVSCLELTPEGRLVSGSDDKTVRIWDLQEGVCLKVLGDFPDAISDVATVQTRLGIRTEAKTYLFDVTKWEWLATYHLSAAKSQWHWETVRHTNPKYQLALRGHGGRMKRLPGDRRGDPGIPFPFELNWMFGPLDDLRFVAFDDSGAVYWFHICRHESG